MAFVLTCLLRVCVVWMESGYIHECNYTYAHQNACVVEPFVRAMSELVYRGLCGALDYENVREHRDGKGANI